VAIPLAVATLRRIPEHRVWTYLIQVAEGLQYIHSRRILHRDLKVRVCVDLCGMCGVFWCDVKPTSLTRGDPSNVPCLHLGVYA
jgi:serine/threonine protein kinase